MIHGCSRRGERESASRETASLSRCFTFYYSLSFLSHPLFLLSAALFPASFCLSLSFCCSSLLILLPSCKRASARFRRHEAGEGVEAERIREKEKGNTDRVGTHQNRSSESTPAAAATLVGNRAPFIDSNSSEQRGNETRRGKGSRDKSAGGKRCTVQEEETWKKISLPSPRS